MTGTFAAAVPGNDTMFGDAGNDVLLRGDGDDTTNGGADADYMDGGAGTDTLSYEGSPAVAGPPTGVTVDLGAGTASGGHATGDIFTSFENLIGSSFNDVLTSSNFVSTISGGAGNDTISLVDNTSFVGDVIFGGVGNDTINDNFGITDDTFVGGAGNDIINLNNTDDLDVVDMNSGDGIDTINGFDAGGGFEDTLNIDDLISFVGGSTDLAGAVAGGFVNFASNGGLFNEVQVDANGGDNALVTVAFLTGFDFADEADAVASLTGNIVVA